jgi:hypothetical protein
LFNIFLVKTRAVGVLHLASLQQQQQQQQQEVPISLSEGLQK